MSRTTGATETQAMRARHGGRRRVTMTDVAREAGCSQATVSFVLNHAPGIKLSPETKQRVFDAARRMGYAVPASPPPIVTATRGRRIGFIADQLATSPEAMVAIEGLSVAARAGGDVVLVAQTHNDQDLEAELIRTFVEQRVSALVYMAIHTREVTVPAQLAGLDMPVFLLNCYASDQAYPAVVPSEIAGG